MRQMSMVRRACNLMCAVIVLGACSTHRPVGAIFQGSALGNASEFRNPEQALAAWDMRDGAFNGHALVSGKGFVIYWTNSTSSKPGVTDTRSEDHLSIQIKDEFREGSWDVQSGAAIIVYSAGRFDAKNRPACVGVARSGLIQVVMAGQKKAVVSLDVDLEFIDTADRKPICQPGPLKLNFTSTVSDSLK